MGPAIFWEILGRHLGILLDVWGDLGETFRYTFGCLGRLVFGEQSEPYMLTYNTIVRTTCVGPDGACDFLGILGIYLGIYLGRLFRNYILIRYLIRLLLDFYIIQNYAGKFNYKIPYKMYRIL